MQIGVEKPLINTILIGKLEQQVSYEGIQNLCFACGRVGHRRELCPYVNRGPGSPVRAVPEFFQGPVSPTQERHDHSPPTSSKNKTEDVHEGDYRPWLVVSCKKAGLFREMLFRVNLPSNLVQLIMSCVTSVSTSILFNGGALDSF